MTEVVRSEFILGGQRSGKSRRAELIARQWLDASPDHKAVMIATAQPWDDEMRERIVRHQQDRAERVPGMTTMEEPHELAQAIKQHCRADTLVVVDCLTLWLTNLMMPAVDSDQKRQLDADPRKQFAAVSIAIADATGPLVLVGNEIGLGVIPMGRETRAFVDALGWLNQEVARACERVTFMAAGLPLALKGPA